MQQNIQLWLVPEPGQELVCLLPEESASFSFTESLDGKFSYEIWILADAEGEPVLGVGVNGKDLYRNLRVGRKGKWFLMGGVTLPKGEHRLELCSRCPEPIRIFGLIMSRNSGYIRSGLADRHRAMLVSGKEIVSLLEEEFAAAGQETPEEKARRLEQLKNMGFLEREDQYTAEGICRSGVPMGGIGAGKIELDPDGIFTAITINNNQDVPIYRADGSFFGVWWKSEGASGSSLLLRGGHLPASLPRVPKIRYEGSFPRAHLEYAGLPFSLQLDAFSPLIPYDVPNSSIPGVVYRFTAKNPLAAPLEISLVFSWENLIGTGGSMTAESRDSSRSTPPIFNTWNPGYTWCNRIGNRQTAWEDPDSQGILFSAGESHGNPSSFGEYTLLSPGPQEAVSICTCWDSRKDAERFWADFSRNGAFSGPYSQQPAKEAESHASAALSRRITVPPQGTASVVFVLSWYFPHLTDSNGKETGVYYANLFGGSRQCADHLLACENQLRESTMEFEQLIRSSSLPEWLQQKLIDDRFPIYTNSWFTKDGKFAVNEAPTGMMGCLGTMDQRLACSSLYTDFFPALDRTELELFARLQGLDGSIPHDLGSSCFHEDPQGGTWSDLCSSFVLQVYKHYLYTGDENFLKEMYLRIQKAVAFQCSIDYDRNGIPDVGPGNGTTYDTYHWYGTCSFVAGLWLAELQACIRLAEMRQDPAFAKKCRALFSRAQRSMLDELWREFPYGGHFINYHDSRGENESENCFIAQLAGQWFADLMDLGDLVPADKIRQALRTVWNRNICFRDFALMTDEITPEGDPYGYGYTFLQYDEVYYGCLALSRGMREEGMECFRRIWAAASGSPFTAGLTYYADGTFSGLPYYMTNPASLFLLNALSGWLPDAVRGELRIKIASPDQTLELPLFSPRIWVWLSYRGEGRKVRYELRVLKVLEDAVFDTVRIVDPADDLQAAGVEGEQSASSGSTVFRAVRPLRAGDRISFSAGGRGEEA